MKSLLKSLFLMAVLCAFWPSTSQAISRAEVIDRARAYCLHPWTCDSDNLQASCLSGYSSEFVIGDHMGLPYDWGGYVTLHNFDLRIANGYGAGTPPGGDAASCTTGVDCSGYVSVVWNTGHYGTWTIEAVTSIFTSDNDLLPGDAFNEPGYHITLFYDRLADGSLRYYEAMPPVTWLNPVSSWSGVSGFDRIRFDDITDGGSDLGTLSNPIVISSFPYSDDRNTLNAPSDLLDACGAMPGTDESGREFIYVFDIQQPGQLVVTVTDGSGVDIDVHLYRDVAERDCFARHDSMLDLPIDVCGRYYLVADTFVNSSGVEQAGLYHLEVEFTPGAGTCQTHTTYDFMGALGEPCGNPYDPDGPFCNPNLGALTCLYGSTDSFCSKPCESESDCLADFPGGCCADIDDNDFYCLPSSFCEAPEPDGGDVDAGDLDGGFPDAGTEDAGGVDAGGVDAGGVDAGGVDAGGEDAGGVDAGGVDAGGVDAGGVDAGGEDAGLEDAGSSPGDQTGSNCPDGLVDYEGIGCAPPGWEPEGEESCGCAGAGSPTGGLAFFFLAMIFIRRRGNRQT